MKDFKQFIKTTIREFLTEQKINEISPDLFKSAINVSKERGTRLLTLLYSNNSL